MRYVVTTGPERMDLRDGPAPVPSDGEVLVRVDSVGLCGGDYTFFSGAHPYVRYPQVQGHEVVGTTLDDGRRVAVEPLRPCGACFPCRRGRYNCCADLAVMGVHTPGGLAEVIAVPAERLHPTGDLPAEVAVLIEPVSIGLQAVHRAGVTAGDLVVVLGAGPIGLLATLAAHDRGARVLTADRVANRLASAAALGASVVDVSTADLVDVVAEASHGEGAAVVIEATGVPALLRTAVDLVAHSGTVVVVGLSTQDVSIPVIEFSRKELAVLGSRNSTALFPAAVDLVARHANRLAPLVTQTFPLASAADAITFARSHLDDVVKVVVRVPD